MKWLIAFTTAAIAFGILDAIWLGWALENFYRPAIGAVMANSFRMGPAVLFYAMYIAGIVWFAVRPGIEGEVSQAALNGALLGGLCYATYDLTNQVTLKVWPAYVTVVDIIWGAFATATAASVATLAVKRMGFK